MYWYISCCCDKIPEVEFVNKSYVVTALPSNSDRVVSGANSDKESLEDTFMIGTFGKARDHTVRQEARGARLTLL